MRFISLASSSKANCYVVEHSGAVLLVDAGLRKRETIARLHEVDIEPKQLIAILLSHHHSDHAGRAGEISAGLHIPVYCSDDTLEAAPASLMEKAECVLTFQPGDALFIEKSPFEVQPVITYHTPGAVGFRISAAGRHVSVFTDVAELSGGVAEALERSHLAGIEADYSEPMLEGCGYDPELKRRIRLSHTSNEKLAAFFTNGFKGETLHSVVLLHTSRAANCGFIAGAKITDALAQQFPNRSIKVWVAEQEQVTGPLDV
jgi:phosphoribosyl 1,2-cyclic phosphodiesterase